MRNSKSDSPVNPHAESRVDSCCQAERASYTPQNTPVTIDNRGTRNLLSCSHAESPESIIMLPVGRAPSCDSARSISRISRYRGAPRAWRIHLLQQRAAASNMKRACCRQHKREPAPARERKEIQETARSHCSWW